MLHVGIDDRLKTEAAERRALPAGLSTNFAKGHEALMDRRPPIQHGQVMNEAQALIDKKRWARSRSSDRSAPRRA
jgi:DNA-damage-inducible protein J